MNDPDTGFRGLRARISFKRISPRLFRISQLTTTLATRDVFEPRDSAARISASAASLYKKETF